MSISYDYYRIFYYVAKYQSFTKAAEILLNSQPNITRAMNNLESQLNVKLLIRSRKGIQLTKEGETLFFHIEKAYAHIMAGESAIQDIKQEDQGTITIGITDIALQLYVMEKLKSFKQKYPLVKIEIKNHSSFETVRSIKSGIVEIGFMATPIIIESPIRSIDLYQFQDVLAGNINYKTKDQISLSELKDYDYIGLSQPTTTFNFYNLLFEQYQISHHPSIEAQTTDQVKAMIQAGLGIGFIPQELLSDDLKVIHLKEKIPTRKVILIYDTSRPQSSLIRKFIQTLY